MPLLGKAWRGKAWRDEAPVDIPPAEGRWHSRPLAAALVRLGIATVPLASALAAAFVVTRLWARPRPVADQLGWCAASLGAAVATSYLMARAARRFLPLATLLKLSLAFPDRTPSRFAVALKAGTISDLKERARRLTDPDANIPMARAASEVILLALALTRHDRGTRGHSERVRAFTDVLAEELRLSPGERDRLQWAGLLHDIGKVAVPNTILNKPGPLTAEEWEVMRRHPAEGAKMLAPLAEWLGPWAGVVAQHHERYNGSGYPYGLRGEEICLGARIVAVADTFEVMTSARSYKRPLSAAEARREISAKAGDLFDPGVVRALLTVSIGRLRWISGPAASLLAMPVFSRLETVAQTLQSAARGSWTVAAAGTMAAVVAVAPVAPKASVSAVSAPAPRPAVALPAALPVAAAGAAAPARSDDPSPTPADTAPSAPSVVPSEAPATSAPTRPSPPPPAPSPVEEPTTGSPRVDAAPAPEGPPSVALGTAAQQLNVKLPDSVPAIPVAVTVTGVPLVHALTTALPALQAPAPAAQ